MNTHQEIADARMALGVERKKAADAFLAEYKANEYAALQDACGEIGHIYVDALAGQVCVICGKPKDSGIYIPDSVQARTFYWP